MSLCLGVFFWCGCAEYELHGSMFRSRKSIMAFFVPFGITMMFGIVNLWTHGLFSISADGVYRRHWLFHVEMAVLLAMTLWVSVRILRHRSRESDPYGMPNALLTASFPLCLAAAWALSFAGESVPVICVCIMVELLCIYIGNTMQEISLDKLTQVNNRQNLLGFMEYKLKNHEEDVYLMMMDLDDFKMINDRFGYLEGDNALVMAAKALKTACGSFKRRPYIARYAAMNS